MRALIKSLNVSGITERSYRGETIRTGIYKSPIGGRVTLGMEGLEGDVQADRSYHGGPDKAVYAFTEEAVSYWRATLGRSDLAAGAFGENLTLAGLKDAEIRLGDVFEAGTARLQVSEPRIPCFKLTMAIGAGPGFGRQFLDSGLTGFYLRVLQPGSLAAGDSFTLLERDERKPTIAAMVAATQGERREATRLRALARIDTLSSAWRGTIDRMLLQELRGAQGWSGTRRFRIAHIGEDVTDVSVVHLTAEDGLAPAPFLPGQFIVLSLEIDGVLQRRPYSIIQNLPTGYAIAVKRLEGGLVSRFLNDPRSTSAGVDVQAPSGAFHLDPEDRRPLVLVGAGIGVTPLLPMLEMAADQRREVLFVQAARTMAALALRQHSLAAQSPTVRLAYRVSREAGSDGGRIDAPFLARLGFTADAQFYLCGPGSFIADLHAGLLDLGVAPDRIRYETFGPSTLKPSRPIATGGIPIPVHLTRDGRQLFWTPAAGTLLDFLEAEGIGLPSGCRAGSCGLCETGLAEGKVRYVEPIDPPPAGRVLPCCAVPLGPVALDL